MSDNLAQLSEPMTLMRTKDVKHLADRIEELEAKLAQQDDLVQAAVAAALREAAQAIQGDEMLSPIGAHRVSARILTLIPEDAQAALDRVVAAERDKAASLVEECLWGAHWTHWRLGAVDPQDLAAAIRKGGE